MVRAASLPSLRSCAGADPQGPPVPNLVDRVLSASVCRGTRKVVNYTWLRRSHGKLWWRPVAVLTCKLCSLNWA